jgi:hypothetical protein
MLLEADVEIYSSSGVTDGSGHFGYVIYFKEADYERAARALGAVMLPKILNPPAADGKGEDLEDPARRSR